MQRQRNVGWTISLALLAAVIFTPYRAFKGEPVSQLFSSLYLSLHRPIWAVCFGWLVVSCATGHGGFIDRLLAYRFFRAPSALSYLAYLIHPVLMLYHTGNVRERVYLSHYLFLNTFLARTVLAFAAAYLLYVTVELPFAQLERYVFPRRNRSKTAATTIPCNATIGRPIHMIMHSESSSCGNCRKPLPDSGASSLLSGRTLSLGLSASDASVLHADSLHGPCGFYRPRTCDQPPIHSHPATSASFVTRTTSASSSSSASHRGTHH